MKKIVLAAVIAAVVCGMGRLVWAGSGVKATPAAQIIENEGDSDTYIGPVYFPKFYKHKGEKVCKQDLAIWSEDKILDFLNKKGLVMGESFSDDKFKNCKHACERDASGSCVKVACSDDNARGIDVESGLDLADDDGDGDKDEDRPGKIIVENEDGKEDDYYDLKGLSGEVEITPGYEESAKALFSWTVRVEGSIPKDRDHKSGKKISGISIWPVLCHPWHGTSYQDYEGGQVKTQLYILDVKTAAGTVADDEGYVAVGDPVEMTVPPTGKSKVKIVTVSDPTLTGSYAVTPDDFGGELPGTIKYKLKWANGTALRIKSPKGQRNMVVTVMPLTE